MEKSCINCIKCKWLKRYFAEDGSWIDICESLDPEDENDGIFYVAAIDVERFDASFCINFSAR